MTLDPKPKLGRLMKVNLRDIWTSEPYDFTPWLAQEENLKLLGEALDMELALVQAEKGVGSFSCDILAKDMVTDQYVAIENQLESTDHLHLGQLVTYAAGLDAVAVVWISKSMREEHRQALDWLNSKTSEDLSFYGVEVELWRIGVSDVAPRFNVVARPNTYQKAARHSKEAASAASGAGQLYLAYFTALREYLAEHAPQLKTMKPSADKWTNISVGRTGFALVVEASLQKRFIEVKFYVHNDPEKTIGAILATRMPEIEAAIPGAKLDLNEGKKHTSVDIVLDADPTDLADRDRQIAWLGQQVIKFDQVFRPLVKELP